MIPIRTGRLSTLLDAPIQPMIRTAAHYDALYREFRSALELDPSRLEAVPGRSRAYRRTPASFLGVWFAAR